VSEETKDEILKCESSSFHPYLERDLKRGFFFFRGTNQSQLTRAQTEV